MRNRTTFRELRRTVLKPRRVLRPCSPSATTDCDPFCSRAADRKSTRLNSSHGYISYAVFCLKKKNRDPSRAAEHDRGQLRRGAIHHYSKKRTSRHANDLCHPGLFTDHFLYVHPRAGRNRIPI